MDSDYNIGMKDLSGVKAWINHAALYSVESHFSNGLQTAFVKTDQDTISVLQMKR